VDLEANLGSIIKLNQNASAYMIDNEAVISLSINSTACDIDFSVSVSIDETVKDDINP